MAFFTFCSPLFHAFTVKQLCLLIEKGKVALLIWWLLAFVVLFIYSLIFSVPFPHKHCVCAMCDGGGYSYGGKRCVKLYSV